MIDISVHLTVSSVYISLLAAAFNIEEPGCVWSSITMMMPALLGFIVTAQSYEIKMTEQGKL